MELHRKKLAVDCGGVNEILHHQRNDGDSRFSHVKPEIFKPDGSVVYFSAFDNLLRREVLIQRLGREISKEILSQAELLRKFSHDNIAIVYDLVTSTLDGSSYFVSEILDNHLENVMYSDQMTFSHIALFAYQIVRGLKYLHSAGLSHGYLNPSNILISCHDLLLKISGFGTESENYDFETNACYYPPEKLLRLENANNTLGDIWSAGCILIEMLLRKKLFLGPNSQEVLLRIIDSIYLNEDDWSNVFKFVPNKMLKNHPLKPRQPIRSIFSCYDLQVVSLLESMVAFPVVQRISAEELLSHSFFLEYHCPEDEPSISEDISQFLTRKGIVESRSEQENKLSNSFSIDDILNTDIPSIGSGDRVALNNFRNNLERNSPPSVRTPSPNIMDLLIHPKSNSFPKNMECGTEFPYNSELMQSFSSSFMERIWNEGKLSLSSSSSCNSINSITCRPSAKELQHKLKHTSGSDSEKESAEMTDEKIKEDAEINSIVEALKQFQTANNQSSLPSNVLNRDSNNSQVHLKTQKPPSASTFMHNLQFRFLSNATIDEEFLDSDVPEKQPNKTCIQVEQVQSEVEKFLAAHRDRKESVLRECYQDTRTSQEPTKELHYTPDSALAPENTEKITDSKKSEETTNSWTPSGRKLLLEQIETEKKARRRTGCHKHKIHLSYKSKEDSEDYIEIGCKLTSSEFDELYRLPTEHLKRDNSSWRRYADDMNHSLTGHHGHHHCFLKEDGQRSSRLSEGGACGGHDYGSLDDLGSSNSFYGSCIKCDVFGTEPKVPTGRHWNQNDFSPEEPDVPIKSFTCSTNCSALNRKNCLTPKVVNASSRDEGLPSPESPPSSPPVSRSQKGARPKKSRKYFGK